MKNQAISSESCIDYSHRRINGRYKGTKGDILHFLIEYDTEKAGLVRVRLMSRNNEVTTAVQDE